MDIGEMEIGIIVTLAIGVLLVYSIARIWAYENERPTETIVPD